MIFDTDIQVRPTAHSVKFLERRPRGRPPGSGRSFKGADGLFDKKAYQRELMRKRRLAEKGETP